MLPHFDNVRVVIQFIKNDFESLRIINVFTSKKFDILSFLLVSHIGLHFKVNLAS